MTIKTKLIQIVFLLMPSLVFGQMQEFQQEFMQVNNRYLSESNIMLTQQYIYMLDSATAVPIDSSYCYIEKYDNIMYYLFNGVESFSDGNYLVRVSNPDKYMIVSYCLQKDTSAFRLIFNEGFSNFKNAEKLDNGDELSHWKLTGGTYGVLSADIVFDIRESKIKKIFVELSPDNPLANQIYPRKPGEFHTVFIKINYDYTNELNKTKPQLSDYIHVENEEVTLAEKFKDYQIKYIK